MISATKFANWSSPGLERLVVPALTGALVTRGSVRSRLPSARVAAGDCMRDWGASAGIDRMMNLVFVVGGPLVIAIGLALALRRGRSGA